MQSILIASSCIVFVLAVILWRSADLFPFFMYRPSINVIILILTIAGLIICFKELRRNLESAKQIDIVRDPSFIARFEQSLNELKDGSVKERITREQQIMDHGAGAEALQLLSDSEIDSEESRGLSVRYILGVLVFLGLIGTFWGVLLTVEGVQKVLQTLEPTQISDPSVFIVQLKSSMGGLLGGLSTAFSTSLFGLAGSVFLGFIELQVRKARGVVLGELDRFSLLVLTSRAASVGKHIHQTDRPTTPVSVQREHLYHTASQEIYSEHLRKLTDVISVQNASAEKLNSALMEMKGILETIRDEDSRNRDIFIAQNSTMQSQAEKTALLARNLEKLINEVKLNREASELVGKSYTQTMKLEGEITNKTLSLGFSDLLGTIRELEAVLDNRKQDRESSQ